MDVFLSTPSARRATALSSKVSELMEISIHALREEGDVRSGRPAHGAARISIHALREEGDAQEPVSAEQDVQFLSTPSARRAT